jgi:hypothetical protein
VVSKLHDHRKGRAWPRLPHPPQPVHIVPGQLASRLCNGPDVAPPWSMSLTPSAVTRNSQRPRQVGRGDRALQQEIIAALRARSVRDSKPGHRISTVGPTVLSFGVAVHQLVWETVLRTTVKTQSRVGVPQPVSG